MPTYMRLVLAALTFAGCQWNDRTTLIGHAELPADTFVEGPTSGQFIEVAGDPATPFLSSQPVQGFSALLIEGDGSLLALPDNGFGSKENSPDYLLRVFRLKAELRTPEGGSGSVEFSHEFFLRDPERLIPWPIVADLTHYPGSQIPVDSAITLHRLLTGADFDVESFRQIADGSFYFGDEFGPFLLHTDDTGRLLESPIALPGVWSPQHPRLGERTPNLPRSAGFEGMALSADGRSLFPMLEKPLEGDDDLLRIYRYDLESNKFARHGGGDGPSYALYQLSPEASYAPEFTHWRGDRYLVLERDSGQGPTAVFKRVFALKLAVVEPGGVLEKEEVVDLLDIADPMNLSTRGTERLKFAYETTEALDVLDGGSFVLVNDNNYPFGRGRYWEEDAPDPTEIIVLEVDAR